MVSKPGHVLTSEAAIARETPPIAMCSNRVDA